MKKREELSPEEVRETAISALENAGVQTTGNEEVEKLVNRFVEEYENNPREEVREAAESLAEKWGGKGVTELEQVTITGKPAAEQDLWEQAIARREAGERPPSDEELSPAQKEMVRKAKAEARGEANKDMEKYGTGREAEKPDIALAQAEIKAKEEERKRYAKWLENHPEVTPGREALYAFRAEERGGRTETGGVAEPETELAEAEEQNPRELAESELKNQGVDLAGFKEEYDKLQEESAETNEETAELHRKAAEMTGKALEEIRSVEDKIREKYKNNPDVLAALDKRIGAIQEVHDNSLERAEKYEKLAAKEHETSPAVEEEPKTRTEELAALAREKWKPKKEEIAGVEEVYPEEKTAEEQAKPKEEPVEVAGKKEPATRPEEEIRPEPVKVAEREEEISPVEEPIKPEPVEEKPEVAHGEKRERPTARDILKGIDFGTGSEDLGEFNAEERRAELEEQQRKEAERKSEAGGPKGLAGGERGEEVAEVKPSTAGEETEEEKRRRDLLTRMSGEGPEVKLGRLRGGAEEDEKVAPKTGPVAVLKLNPAQRDVLDYGTPREKRELRAQLMDRKRRTERMVETARARGEETEPLQNEIAAIDDLLKDKRLSGA